MQKWFCLVYSARIEVLKFMHIQAAETIFLLTCRPTLKRTWTVWSAASAWCSNNKDCKGLKYHDRLCCTESFPCFHLVHCLHIASMCFSTRKSKPAIYVLVSNRSLNILVTLEIKARYECQLSSNTWSFFIHKSWTLSWLKVVVFLWVVDQVSPFAPENKKLKPGLNAMHRLSPNNRSGWRNRGGERRRRACTQETSSGGLVKDKSWVGGWVESSESLRCCEGALPPLLLWNNAE